jgi:hypothetical protein
MTPKDYFIYPKNGEDTPHFEADVLNIKRDGNDDAFIHTVEKSRFDKAIHFVKNCADYGEGRLQRRAEDLLKELEEI